MPQNVLVDNFLTSKVFYIVFYIVFLILHLSFKETSHNLAFNYLWQAEVFWYRNGESLDFQAFQAKNLTPDSSSVLLQHGDYSDFLVIMPIWNYHRKIRLIEGNAKSRRLKKVTCTGTLRQVFICLRPRTPYPPPPTYSIYTVYLFTGKEGRVEPGRRLKGQQFTKLGRPT